MGAFSKKLYESESEYLNIVHDIEPIGETLDIKDVDTFSGAVQYYEEGFWSGAEKVLGRPAGFVGDTAKETLSGAKDLVGNTAQGLQGVGGKPTLKGVGQATKAVAKDAALAPGKIIGGLGRTYQKWNKKAKKMNAGVKDAGDLAAWMFGGSSEEKEKGGKKETKKFGKEFGQLLADGINGDSIGKVVKIGTLRVRVNQDKLRNQIITYSTSTP
jgi:hypothetical protein